MLTLKEEFRLKDYQRDTIKWMKHRERKKSVGGGVFFEMGLGKTYTMIAWIIRDLFKFPHRKTLIIVPSTLINQWISEFYKFVNNFNPDVHIYKFHGKKNRENSCENRNRLKIASVYITSYSTFLAEAKMIDKCSLFFHQSDSDSPLLLSIMNWSKRVILDEAQKMRSAKSKTFQKIMDLTRSQQFCYALTGTPYNNRLSDIANLAKFFRVKTFSTDSFWNEVTELINSEGEMSKERGIKLFQQFLDECVIIKQKKEVGCLKLPSKKRRYCSLTMTGTQRRVYDKNNQEAIVLYRDFNEKRISYQCLLQKISQLRHICNLIEYNGNMFSIKWTFIVQELRRLSKEFPEDKVIIFSQYVSDFDKVIPRLQKNGVNYLCYTGKLDIHKKQQILDTFTDNPDIQVMLVSIQCGGTGLNLVMANHVYLMEPLFNPFVTEQAIDRVHRIGQTKTVYVTQLVIKDSVEMWVRALNDHKMFMAERVLYNQAHSRNKVTKEELKRLFYTTVGCIDRNTVSLRGESLRSSKRNLVKNVPKQCSTPKLINPWESSSAKRVKYVS